MLSHSCWDQRFTKLDRSIAFVFLIKRSSWFCNRLFLWGSGIHHRGLGCVFHSWRKKQTWKHSQECSISALNDLLCFLAFPNRKENREFVCGKNFQHASNSRLFIYCGHTRQEIMNAITFKMTIELKWKFCEKKAPRGIRSDFLCVKYWICLVVASPDCDKGNLDGGFGKEAVQTATGHSPGLWSCFSADSTCRIVLCFMFSLLFNYVTLLAQWKEAVTFFVVSKGKPHRMFERKRRSPSLLFLQNVPSQNKKKNEPIRGYTACCNSKTVNKEFIHFIFCATPVDF